MTDEQSPDGSRTPEEADGDDDGPVGAGTGPKRRRRGSRGGRNRTRPALDGTVVAGDAGDDGPAGDLGAVDPARTPELPDRASENRPRDRAVLDRATVRRDEATAATAPSIGDTRPGPGGGARPTSRPRIGDTRPAPTGDDPAPRARTGTAEGGGRGEAPIGGRRPVGDGADTGDAAIKPQRRRGGRGRSTGSGGSGQGSGRPVEAVLHDAPHALSADELERRRGRERNGRPVGRYLMAVHVSAGATQIAVLEGRSLLEHYISRPADDTLQIHGNIYLAKVQNVLPGMEAAFVDIGTPKNAVLYRGDVHYDPEDVEKGGAGARIEQLLKARQSIVTQVTKNPIAHKGARLTQEVSLPGRFVVLIPHSATDGISKRLPDDERKRLRAILDRIKPAEHGVIVRTAAEGVTTEELERDVARLLGQWAQISTLAARSQAPALLYREPDMAVRIIREEFNAEFRGVIIDDESLFHEVRDYVASISPALADRVELYDPAVEALPLYEHHHVHEQLHKALDRKVWLPSGGSLIIESTEALTVIDINTGKNVGTSSLEETVYRNNLEAATEIARQLRLRDIGGIIVIDFIDMERKDNREAVIRRFRDALARDKTRTQVFDISELGLVEMTRKRIGEGLLESFAGRCPTCEGRGVVIDQALLD
jgi:ribonuclease E